MAALTLAASALACCTSETDVPDVPGGYEDPGVMLRINVAVGSTGAASRADNGNDGYESPADEKEKVKTLRVIIVSPDGKSVEHNRMVNMTANSDGTLEPVNDNLIFRVSSNKELHVWLLANEASLTAPAGVNIANVSDWLNSIHPAVYENFTYGDFSCENFNLMMQDWTVTGYGQKYDNGDYVDVSAFDGQYKPMSEMFAIKTLPPLDEEIKDDNTANGSGQIATRTQDANMFITRAVSKVTFRFDLSEFEGSGFDVAGIRLNGLNSDEYVFPRNASYSPAKYIDGKINDTDANGKPIIERYITAFDAPESRNVINLMPDIELVNMVKVSNKVIRGPYYFPESLSDKESDAYTVQLCLKDSDNPADQGLWLDAKPLGAGDGGNILVSGNHQAIARNTHLYIDIKFKEKDIFYTAIEAPYNSVELKPSFGL